MADGYGDPPERTAAGGGDFLARQYSLVAEECLRRSREAAAAGRHRAAAIHAAHADAAMAVARDHRGPDAVDDPWWREAAPAGRPSRLRLVPAPPTPLRGPSR